MQANTSGKTAFLKIGIWLNPETGAIHIATHDAGGFITTVNNDRKSKRGHPNLFRKLARCLRTEGMPYPEISKE